MTEEHIIIGYKYLEKKKQLKELQMVIREKFSNLNENSTVEDVGKFISYIIQSGYKDSLYSAIFGIIADIDRDIIDIEDKIKRL